MPEERLWALACTSCGHEIKMPGSWFRQPGNACPHCSHPIDTAHIEKMLGDVKKKLADMSTDDDDDIEFNF